MLILDISLEGSGKEVHFIHQIHWSAPEHPRGPNLPATGLIEIYNVINIRGSFAGFGDKRTEASYYNWVDQHDTLGLGNDVPISTGNENDALLALVGWSTGNGWCCASPIR